MKLPNTKFDLTEGQRTLVLLSLEIARDKFKQNAIDLHDESPRVYKRLVEQFERQFEEAVALRARLEAAGEITVGAVVPDEEPVITPHQDQAITAILANDEASTDDELLEHFTRQFGITEHQAKAYIGGRTDALRGQR